MNSTGVTKFGLEDVLSRQMHARASGSPLGIVRNLSSFIGFKDVILWEETLEPGRRASVKHRHTLKEEVVWVLEGTLTVEFGDRRMVADEGEFVAFLPDETRGHVVLNESDRPVRFIGFSSNPQNDETIVTD